MSSVDESGRARWEKMQTDSQSRRSREVDEGSLKGGDGGGTSGDGMDGRVAKLEADMDYVKRGVDKLDTGVSDIKKSIADLRVETARGVEAINGQLGKLNERTRHFPTRWEAFLVFATLLAAAISVLRLLGG